MNFNFSKYNVFVAGGLGDMGRELVKVLLKSKSHVKILSSSNKFDSRYESQSKKTRLEIIKTDYSNYENLFEMFQKNCIKGKINCLISFVGSGKIEGEYPYQKKEVQRIWDINYFSNRNLASAIFCIKSCT